MYTQGVGTSTFACSVPETPRPPTRNIKPCIVVAAATPNQDHWLEPSYTPAHQVTATTVTEQLANNCVMPIQLVTFV